MSALEELLVVQVQAGLLVGGRADARRFQTLLAIEHPDIGKIKLQNRDVEVIQIGRRAAFPSLE